MTAALEYARLGWPVFPCVEGAKVPLGHLAPNGCRSATADTATIARWWASRPYANIGIACGAPGPDVVDVDCKDDAPGIATMRRLQRAGLLAGACRLVATPSGGWHVYFRGSHQGNGRLPRHGVDFRSAGGYVVAPPSSMDVIAYVLHDARDADATVDFARIRRFLDPPRPPTSRTHRTTAGGVRGLAAWVARQDVGNRNNGLYWAACQATKDGASPDDLEALMSAACAADLAETEARRTVASAYRRFGGRR